MSSASAAHDASNGLTAAERLMQQHGAQESHKPTVEEVPDEDTLAHPPPSGISLSNGVTKEGETNGLSNGSLSAKAAGKQPLKESSIPKSAGTTLNTASEELFPALGAPKAAGNNTVPSMWSKKPAVTPALSNGTPNGVNGRSASRASTVTSGTLTPASTAASAQRVGPQMSIPGRNTESITLYQSMLKKRDELKKPIADVLRDINKRSKATVEMKTGAGDVRIFSGTGPTDAVRIALKEVANQLCANQSLRLPIPISVRGKVVGKQGSTIQSIQKSSGARIQIAKQDPAETINDEDDLSATVDVIIEGDPFAVQMARQDVQRIVDEHTSSVNTRLKHIPAEYYPFLAARKGDLSSGRDLKLNIPRYHQWQDQAPIQPAAPRGPTAFSPQASLPIQMSGDRQAVAAARAEIDQLVNQLQRELTLEQTSIERGRHQFIVGDMGSSIEDFMAETGCAIIMPPEGHDSEDLYIIGPPERIEDGVNKVIELAASMQSASVDMAKQHAAATKDAQAHARAVTRYLQQRQAIEQLEQQHNARIVPDSTGQVHIYARDGKSAMKARSDLLNLVSGHPPSRFQPLDVDPFFHEHLEKTASQQLRQQHGVRLLVPPGAEGDQIFLVFEDAESELSRRAPSAQDVQEFERALAQAQKHIMDLINAQQDVVSRDVDAPAQYHDKIRKHVDRHHRSLPDSHIPVQVSYGNTPHASHRQPAPSLSLRGPQDSVEALMQSLIAFIEQEKQDETERGFTLEFAVPQKFASHIIGKGGENINRLRDEFDVDIQLSDGDCVVKGPEAKANAAKKHILELVKKLEDEVTHHLNIPAAYHRDLIGVQGSQVSRLQSRYGVRIQFPRGKQADDAASEAGDASQARRNNQQPNEVIVKGPTRGADACREEMLNLLQYVKDNSHSAVVSVAQSQLPSLIGSGGREMDALRLESGAQIEAPNSKDIAAGERAEIKLKGSKEAVEKAKKLIEERAKAFDNTVTKQLEVERRHHRLIIGPQGSTLTSIIEKAGGPADARGRARTVRFPKTAEEGDSIKLEGHSSVVDKLSAAILAIVAEQESQVTDNVDVKQEKHRILIGRGGESKRQLEQQFGVSINIPRQTDTGPNRTLVKITGQPESVEKCKAHIVHLTKEQDGTTIAVPRKFHHAIADNGQFFRRLRNDHKVTVDHSGQRPPPRPTAPTPQRAGGGAMPLITDDASSSGANNHSWETHNLHGSTEDGEIPWVLTGPSPEAISSAQSKLERALQEVSGRDTVGFLILQDPSIYRRVVGPGGSEINRIRTQTGAKIQVPRDQGQGEAIEIIGTQSGVEEARDLILQIVESSA